MSEGEKKLNVSFFLAGDKFCKLEDSLTIEYNVNALHLSLNVDKYEKGANTI